MWGFSQAKLISPILFGTLNISPNQHLVQAGFNHSRHQSTVIPTNGLGSDVNSLKRLCMKIADLNTLWVHFIVLLWFCPVQPSVALFADKEVREIHFLELKLDRFHEFRCDEICRLAAYSTIWAMGRSRIHSKLTQLHHPLQIGRAKPYHDWVGITVDNLCVMGVSISNAIFCLYDLKGMLSGLQRPARWWVKIPASFVQSFGDRRPWQTTRSQDMATSRWSHQWNRTQS